MNKIKTVKQLEKVILKELIENECCFEEDILVECVSDSKALKEKCNELIFVKKELMSKFNSVYGGYDNEFSCMLLFLDMVEWNFTEKTKLNFNQYLQNRSY